jgi:hypothetical protein
MGERFFTADDTDEGTKKMKRLKDHPQFALIRVNSRFFLLLFLVLPLCGFGENTGATLARELSSERDHAGAAIEFRRLGLETPERSGRGGWFWAAAYEYHRAEKLAVSDRMLDRAEDADPLLSDRALLLRGENAVQNKRWDEGAFYFEGALDAAPTEPQRIFAARKLAASRVRLKDLDAAAAALDRSPIPESDGRDALEVYRERSDKRPGLGGALGMLPGFGYFYAGEWANGFRSLILNSLFIFGMVHTAENEQWGAFAVITFFEFTWYSGSIYGGIDAAHRFNRRREDECVNEIVGRAEFEPDYSVLPSVSLQFRF